MFILVTFTMSPTCEGKKIGQKKTGIYYQVYHEKKNIIGFLKSTVKALTFNKKHNQENSGKAWVKDNEYIKIAHQKLDPRNKIFFKDMKIL